MREISQMKYRREIDGLRAVAVIPVILFHAGFSWMSGGFVGVDVFFVISGYLITTIILNELDEGRFSIAGFYERRARRILPALFFVLVCCLPAAYILLLPDQLSSFFKSLVSVMVFLSNIYFRNEVNYFARSSEEEPLLHMWSLAVEEQYYLVFPLLAILLWRGGKRVFVISTMSIAVASFIYADVQSLLRPDKVFFDTRGRVWELFLGSMSAISLLRWRKTELSPSRWLSEAGAALGLGLILWACFGFEQSTPFPGRYALVPTFGAALVILFATPTTVAGRLLSSRAVVGLGLVSYSAYLWHQPLFTFARLASMRPPSEVVFAVLSLASIGLAYVSWRYVERPFRQRQCFTRAQVFSVSVAGIVLFLAVAASGVILKGFPARFSPSDADLLIAYKDRSEFVRARHTTLRSLGAFSGDARFRVLIIGDSFSQDLVNVLYEANLLPGVDLRVRYIPARCQVYQGDEPVAGFVEPRSRTICAKDYYGGLSDLVEAADAVLVTASWKKWSAEHLDETLRRLGISRKERYLVFGRKIFGSINRSGYIRLNADQKAAVRNPVGSDNIDINAIMRRKIAPEHFVDVHALVCGPEALTCPLFDENGALLSYDGSHLTRAGARFLGNRLAKDPVFVRFAESLGH